MKIFLNYRRTDNPHAIDRLVERLVNEFGKDNIYYDIHIPIGVNWRTHIAESVSQCDVFLAVIGDAWVEELKRREGTEDNVRWEIESALQRKVPIVPIQAGQSELPPRDVLPSDIAELADWNGLRLRPGQDFQGDVGRLIDRLRQLARELGLPETPSPQIGSPGPARSLLSTPQEDVLVKSENLTIGVVKVDNVTLVRLHATVDC